MNDKEDPSRSHTIPVEHPERLMARHRGWDPVEDPFGNGLLRTFEQDMFSFFEPFTPPYTDTGYIRPQMLDMALFGYNPFASGVRTDQENGAQPGNVSQPNVVSQVQQPQAQARANVVSLISESGVTEYKSAQQPTIDDARSSSLDSTRRDTDEQKANVKKKKNKRDEEIDYDTGRDGDIDTEIDISSIDKTKALPINLVKVRDDDVITDDNADFDNVHGTNIRNEEYDRDSGFFQEEPKQDEETHREISRNVDIETTGQGNAYISRIETNEHDHTVVNTTFAGVPGMFTNPHDLRSLQANTYEVLNTTMEFRVNMDVLHFKPEEIEIEVEDNKITIHGRHAERQDDHGLIEREFTRIYRVPADADATRVTSCLYANGVLTVRAPKLNAPPVTAE